MDTAADNDARESHLQQLQLLHKKAEDNIDFVFSTLKLPRVRGALKKPRMLDLYFNPASTIAEGNPPNLQLPYLLQNFNDIQRFGSKAYQLPEQSEDMSRFIWYSGLDQDHSFSNHHRTIRYNVVLMAYCVAAFERNVPWQTHCQKGSLSFVMAFLHAWMEATFQRNKFSSRDLFISIWKDAEFDLIQFKFNADKIMRRMLRKLGDVKLPQDIQGLDHEDIGRRARLMSDDEFKEKGLVLAIQYVTHWNRMGAMMDKREEETELVSSGGIDGLMEGMDLEQPAIDLEQINWYNELPYAALHDIDRNIVPIQAEDTTDKRWMTMENVKHIADDKINDICMLLANMGL
ncbi:hypothetical protein BDV96DRAFT_596046 [Lophiotrema nucula]|uniref:Uncharacterized protein n=1 Tax=Lophiotrema nucula TaxID=690887 RepID=A0A6A5ZJ64_9PLEO|nr:hypothetical protein BDV96DRAFT_596046 [Lophiotrema nucula]